MRVKTVPFLDKYEKKKFDFDGFDPAVPYQMVPIDGKRPILVKTSDPPCFLSLENGLIAEMSDFRTEADAPLPNAPRNPVTGAKVPPNTTFKVDLKGLKPDITGLVLEDTENSLSFTSSLTVSVKPRKIVNYRIVFLADPLRKNVRPRMDPRKIMGDVRPLFDKQANIDLVELGDMRDILVPEDLGNPILTSNAKAMDAIEKATPPEIFSGVSFVVYCVWDVQKERGGANSLAVNVDRLNGKDFVFLELSSQALARQVHAAAHEVGHALHLSHQPGDCLMFQTDAVQSNRLQGGDIEVANETVKVVNP